MRNFLLGLGIAVCLLGGTLGGIYWHSHDDVYFEGKEIFQTQENYEAFKLEIAEQTCKIREMIVLSSEPPVVVDFWVRVPHNYEFPYGEKGGTTGIWGFLSILAIPIAIMATNFKRTNNPRD